MFPDGFTPRSQGPATPSFSGNWRSGAAGHQVPQVCAERRAAPPAPVVENDLREQAMFFFGRWKAHLWGGKCRLLSEIRIEIKFNEIGIEIRMEMKTKIGIKTYVSLSEMVWLIPKDW